MAFDVEGAKQAGYSDAEIARHLAGTTNFDVEGARKAGYSDQEIIGQLAGAPAPAAQQGEHGYAPAPPKPEPVPPVVGWNPVGDELGNIYTPQPPPSPGDLRDTVWPSPTPRQAAAVDPSAPPGPLAAPVGGEFGDLSAQPWAQGEPVPEGKIAPAAKIGSAMAEGWRDTPQILTPEAEEGQRRLWGPILGGAINNLYRGGTDVFAAGNALMYGISEGANQITGDPRAGRDALMIQQLLPMARRPGPYQSAVTRERAGPRVSPMMQAYQEAEAAREAARRYGPPEAPTRAPESSEPPAPAVNAGVEAVRAQLGLRDAPHPTPDMTATPAGRAPAFAPRTVTDPLTGAVTQTQVPIDLRLRAAIDAVPDEQAPGFAPPGERPPPVAPGAAGPAMLPPYTEPPPPVPGRGSPNQGADTRAAQVMEEPSTQPPPPPPGEPATGSVGAAASRDITPAAELGMTPAEEAAYRSTAEGNKLLEPQEPGVRDDKEYLTGERVNEAQASQDVEVARELQSLRQQTPELDKKMTADETHNDNITANAIQNAIPGQVQIRAAKDARQAAMKTNEPKVFANATDADVAPIVKEIQDILNDPKNRENSQLQQYVKPLIDRLQNPDGSPKITDPRQLLGWRQDVQHLTSGAAQRSDPNLSRVSGLLGRVLDATDNQLEAAAPGYKASLRDEYRTRSREIDAMEALDDERNKLFDTQNKPSYNAVQRLMRRMVDARRSNDPYDAFTHVSQETLDNFWNIRDSMRRRAAVDRLGAPRSSPTSQNLGDALRGAGKLAIKSAAPTIGAGLGTVLFPGMPMVGSTLGLMAGGTVNHLLSEAGMRQRMTRGLELTNPNKLMHPLN